MQGWSLITFSSTCAAFDTESQWALFQIEIYWCMRQCAVHLDRVSLRPLAESRGWWCYEWVDPNNFRHATRKCVGSSFVYPIFQRNVWPGWEHPICLYRLAVVRMPADKPAVAASLNRDLARIHEWCNHWCMVLNPDKTKFLVISTSRIVCLPYWLGLVWGFHRS